MGNKTNYTISLTAQCKRSRYTKHGYYRNKVHGLVCQLLVITCYINKESTGCKIRKHEDTDKETDGLGNALNGIFGNIFGDSNESNDEETKNPSKQESQSEDIDKD